ncbi:MAG: phytoene/squalene synthase family protein [Trueperaceae bacterium]|nr:phytoene/squalene synthase family protein [Trueperaceae bacterium]
MTVDQAIAACTDATREHSSSFYLGSRIFRGEQRSAVTLVYAVCRAGDDAVDEAPTAEAARERLAAWWGGVERAYAGSPDPDEAVEVGLAWLLERYPVPLEAFDELRLGLLSDLEPADVATMDELMVYCRRVAGVVGWMVAPICGYRGGEETLAMALALGNAMQLTNVLRDVGEDLRMGRCYLPADLRAKYGVDLDDLRAGRVTPGYVALLEELGDLAQALYREGWRGIPRLQGVASLGVAVAALNYEGILRKLRQNGHDNLNRRAYLRPVERVALIPRALVGVVAGGRS